MTAEMETGPLPLLIDRLIESFESRDQDHTWKFILEVQLRSVTTGATTTYDKRPHKLHA